MKNRIIIDRPIISKNKIEISYQIEGAEPWWENPWCRFFQDHEREGFFTRSPFVVEYSTDISATPESVAVLPLICDILPAAWLCDAQVIADSCDQDFYESIPLFKKGYEEMYPMLDFKGELIVKNLVKNQVTGDKSACFFSGGVDSFSTLITHFNEKPALMTLWGSDVKQSDGLGWERTSSHIRNTASEFGLPYVFIKTQFREIITEWEMDPKIVGSGDGYWHGFQHGIAIASHAAPYAYAAGISKIYMASSFSKDDKGITCASYPTIEGRMKFFGCDIIHDEFEKNRLDKIKNICAFRQRTGTPVPLRVCWEADGGRNCSHCEKCLRTMLEIFSQGQSPEDFGFTWNEEGVAAEVRALMEKSLLQENKDSEYWRATRRRLQNPSWRELQQEMRQMPKRNDCWNFFLDLDLDIFVDKAEKPGAVHCFKRWIRSLRKV